MLRLRVSDGNQGNIRDPHSVPRTSSSPIMWLAKGLYS